MLNWTIKPGFIFAIFIIPWLLTPLSFNWLTSLGIWITTLGLHELAHLVCWNILGYKTHTQCQWYGISTRPWTRPKPIWHSSLAAFAGPAASFAAAFYVYTFMDTSNPIAQLWISYNLFLCIYQILPISELDGWHILENLLETIFGVAGIKICHAISFIFCLLLSIGLLITSPIVGFLPAAGAIALCLRAMAGVRENWELDKADIEPRTSQALHEAMQLHQQGKVASAQKKLRELIARGLRGRTIYQAKLMLAQWLLETGEPQEAWGMIQDIPSKMILGPWSAVVHQIAYQSENFDKVHQLAADAFQQRNNASVAIMNAVACAHLYAKLGITSQSSTAEQMLYEVIGWLQAAERLHYRHWSILNGKDFQALKGQELFESFRKSHCQ